jgi:hypothetical protein
MQTIFITSVKNKIKELEKKVTYVQYADNFSSTQGWTKFSRFGDLDALTEEEWDKVRFHSSFLSPLFPSIQKEQNSNEKLTLPLPKQCWAVNVKGQMALLRAALPTFNANADGGAMVITSSVAGTSLGGSSMAYSVTKCAQLHLMRCMAQTQGPKVRINAVLPGLLLTEWVSVFLCFINVWLGFVESVLEIKERNMFADVCPLFFRLGIEISSRHDQGHRGTRGFKDGYGFRRVCRHVRCNCEKYIHDRPARCCR